MVVSDDVAHKPVGGGSRSRYWILGQQTATVLDYCIVTDGPGFGKGRNHNILESEP